MRSGGQKMISALFAEAASRAAGGFTFSVEMVPPATAEGEGTFERAIDAVASAGPLFFTFARKADFLASPSIQRQARRCIERYHDSPLCLNMTCANSTAADAVATLDAFTAMGGRNVFPLRGDGPAGEVPTALALLKLLRASPAFAGVCALTSGYPEGHPLRHAAGLPAESDVASVAEKVVDGGASAVLAQVSCRAESFMSFADKCRAVVPRVPVVPGILAPVQLRVAQRMSALCGVALAEDVSRVLIAAERTLEATGNARRADEQLMADMVPVVARECVRFVQRGHTHAHFFCLTPASAHALPPLISLIREAVAQHVPVTTTTTLSKENAEWGVETGNNHHHRQAVAHATA